VARPWSLLIFAVALAGRIGVLVSPLIPRETVLAGAHREVDAVARSLVSAGRYADPFCVPTGPTAHPLPIHTALQALIYLALGVMPGAAYARSIAAIVAPLAAYPLVYYLVGYVPRYLFTMSVVLLLLAASEGVAWLDRARERA
jgi:hypothetical protein